MSSPEISTLTIAGHLLRAATWGSGVPEIVMLHDGLGSIPQWRSVPGDVCAGTGATVMAYERAGHGESLPTPRGPWPTDWLHHEAEVLAALLDVVSAPEAIVVGHSDGGSIALLHAASEASGVSGVAALAPHSWVEQICFDSIASMRANREAIVNGLSRHHRSPEAVFEAWSGVWVSDAFRSWDIRPQLHTITAPALIAQGANDAYASDDQAHLTATAIGDNAKCQIVSDVGHIMHHDDADVVTQLIVDFVHSISP